MNRLQYCTTCTHPNTRPRITFDRDGVCNGCRRAEEKKAIDWTGAEARLKEQVAAVLADRPWGRQYDCIVPVSGGKDSHYQAWYATNVLKVRTLCVNIQPFLSTEVGAKNLRNLPERLPVDLVSITPNMRVWARLSRLMLERFGDPWPPRQYLMFSHIARVAIEKKIPLMLLGENGDREYGGSNAREFLELDNTGVHARIQSSKRNFAPPREWSQYGFTADELAIYQEPNDEELQASGVQRLFLSDYTPWNNNHHLYIALNVIGGFAMEEQRSVGTYTFGYSTDDPLYELYIWFLWPKYGFCRATKYTSKDIQEGKITRERALELVARYDGEFPWHALDGFCEKTGMKEDEFWDVVARFVGDEENLRREPPHAGWPNIIPAWERVGPRRWRHIQPIHGEERVLEVPLRRPATATAR